MDSNHFTDGNDLLDEDIKEFLKPQYSMRDNMMEIPYYDNFTNYDSISALKETAEYILYAAQMIEEVEKEVDVARNSIEASAFQTKGEEAFDVVNKLVEAVWDWNDWNNEQQKKKTIIRTPKEKNEIDAAFMMVENAVRGANRAYSALNFKVSSLAAAEAELAEARAAVVAKELELAEVEARLAAIDASLAAAEAAKQEMPPIHSARAHASRRLEKSRKKARERQERSETMTAPVDAPVDAKGGMATRKKKYRRRNKTKPKRYKKQIKGRTKKYRMRY